MINKKKIDIKGLGGTFTPLYLVAAVIGCSVLAVAAIWGISYTWYHVPLSVRMGVAVLLVLVSQIAVGVALFQERQGTLLAEGIAVVHCIAVFVGVALLERIFYTGGNAHSYTLACALLILPSAYLLRSIASVIWYAVAVLFWATMDGAVNAPGGDSLMWGLLALAGPFYLLLIEKKDEIRLAAFSWASTLAVFAAFGIAARNAAYIPFLLFAALAGVILLTGYSIDIHKAWGVPFRWLGRFAAAGSLLISCMPVAWDSVISVPGFHWIILTVTALLLLLMGAIYFKFLKKRFWAPTLYALIPLLIVIETILTRNGVPFTLPVLLSSIYILFLGVYEVGQGVRFGKAHHLRWGLVIFLAILIAFLSGSNVSPFVIILALVLSCVAVWQFRRFSGKKKAAIFADARRKRSPNRDHAVSAVRHGHQTRKRVNAAERPAADVETKDETSYTPSWMEQQPETAAASRPPKPVQAEAVITKKAPVSTFVPPVFHEPDQIPLPDKNIFTERPQPGKRKRKAVQSAEPERVSSSPWADMKPVEKKEKHFSRSPWSQEGESKK
jgi:hypothetical protein